MLVLVGSLSFVTAVLAGIVRRELRRHAEFVNEAVERGLLDVLPPRRVAERLLERVYGVSPFNDTVVTALLGGEGASNVGSDLTISEHTEIDYTLTRVDDSNYHLVMETRYSFRNRVPARELIVFATSDATLRDSIVAGCRYPLFELWFVREDESSTLFEDSVESMRDSVNVGIEYVDERGKIHDVPARHPGRHIREVKVGEWSRYLTFFGRDTTQGSIIDRQLYLDKLRIFKIDLLGLADQRTGMELIQRMTLRSTTLQLIEDGFCWWQAPYPCFVERMGFDTKSFDLASDRELRFMVKPFTISSEAAAPTWQTSDEVANVDLQVWMLAGHGMALVWRPA
ncbi:MAG TPA: hypothetical protein VGH76_10640 [Actinomycetospora sp.]|uniref:hypothetical protein n=1 Tax=Actinomycetospora sp. TaxID=1872135 RepID=UPI002F400B6E